MRFQTLTPSSQADEEQVPVPRLEGVHFPLALAHRRASVQVAVADALIVEMRSDDFKVAGELAEYLRLVRVVDEFGDRFEESGQLGPCDFSPRHDQLRMAARSAKLHDFRQDPEMSAACAGGLGFELLHGLQSHSLVERSFLLRHLDALGDFRSCRQFVQDLRLRAPENERPDQLLEAVSCAAATLHLDGPGEVFVECLPRAEQGLG